MIEDNDMTNYVSLQDCCEIINGYAFKSEHYVPQGIRIIRIANVQRGYIADESPCFYSSDDPNASIRYKLFENDLLISLTGNVGRVGLLPHSLLPAALNQRVVCLRLRPESPVTKEFIFCCLNREEFENDCILNSTGVAQKNLSSKWLKAYKIPVPTPLQQQQICKSISAIDKLHNALNRKLSHFDCLVKSRFIEMFESVDIPRMKLPEVVWFQEGPGVRKQQYTKTGVKLLNVANLHDGILDTSNTDRYISQEEADGKYSHFQVDEGDLIIASSGIKVEYFDKKMGFARKEQLPLCMNTSTIRFKPLDESVINIIYFQYFLKSEDFKKQLIRQITGSAQLNFGPSHLKRMSVPLPDIELQTQFAVFVTQVDKLRFDVQQQIEKLETLKKSLMQEYFG